MPLVGCPGTTAPSMKSSATCTVDSYLECSRVSTVQYKALSTYIHPHASHDPSTSPSLIPKAHSFIRQQGNTSLPRRIHHPNNYCLDRQAYLTNLFTRPSLNTLHQSPPPTNQVVLTHSLTHYPCLISSMVSASLEKTRVER